MWKLRYTEMYVSQSGDDVVMRVKAIRTQVSYDQYVDKVRRLVYAWIHF